MKEILKELQQSSSIALGIVSLMMFFTNNLTDAIYLLVMAVWVKP